MKNAKRIRRKQKRTKQIKVMITEDNAESHEAAATQGPDSEPSIESQNGESSSISNGENPAASSSSSIENLNGRTGLASNLENSAASVSSIQNPKSKILNVDGASLLNELESLLTRFVVLPGFAAETLALWILHTYAFELRDVSTYLGIESPEKRCGKTTLLSVLSRLANRPVAAANISPSAFFRVIEEMRPTLLIDEADTFLRGNDELRGILNAGYTRDTAYVVRVTQADPNQVGTTSTSSQCSRRHLNGDDVEVVPTVHSGVPSADRPVQSPAVHNLNSVFAPSTLLRFSCWCPKVMAAIGRLPDTLADRCIVIRMQRKTIHEDCDRLRKFEASNLRERCAQFVSQNRAAIASAEPEIPQTLHDRAADIWEPLFVLADLAGGDWPRKARQAAEALATGAQGRSPIGAFMLDIYSAMAVANTDRISSRDLVSWLNGFTDRPWHDLPGLRIVNCGQRKEVTELWLAQQLRPYGIRPKTLRIGDKTPKGYLEADLLEPFRRYVPRSEWEAFKAENERQIAEREAAERAKINSQPSAAAAPKGF
jgi:putative DNA primase/helicase